MGNEITSKKNAMLQMMSNIECCPVTKDTEFTRRKGNSISLSNLSILGITFQPVIAAIQSVTSEAGKSGLYYVNTQGKTMFQYKESFEYLGSLKNSSGAVGGGNAKMTRLACDPTMLFMAIALMNIEKKLDDIQEVQQDILAFLEQKEMAKQQGNLNVLSDILKNYKYNWDNEKYKNNKHIQVQEILRDSEHGIILYREQIAMSISKRSFIHGDKEVRSTMKRLQEQFKEYQLALYLLSYSSFLEVMLLDTFDEGYLSSIVNKIEDYSFQYRKLYTDSYNLMEEYSKSSVESAVLSGLSFASKALGGAIAKAPAINKTQLDENLIEAGGKLQMQSAKKTNQTLEQLAVSQRRLVNPFVENIRMVNEFFNTSSEILFDKEKLYIRQVRTTL
jgi:hypothetical protein